MRIAASRGASPAAVSRAAIAVSGNSTTVTGSSIDLNAFPAVRLLDATSLRFYEANPGIHYTSFGAGVQADNLIYTWPTVAPTANQVLISSGGATSNLSWSTITSSSLSSTGVTPGSYGTSTSVPSFTVDSAGRITLAANVPIAAWFLGGNSGTNPATNFVGTTDLVDLNFRTNNVTRFTISSTGNALYSGAFQVNGATTFAGTASINTTGFAGTSIGNAFASVTLTASTFDVTAGTVNLKSSTPLYFYTASNTYSSSFVAGAQTANLAYSLPGAAPTANQVLISSGGISSSLSWATLTSSSLSATGVSPGLYGTSTSVPTFTVDAAGRITFAANVPISAWYLGGNSGTNPGTNYIGTSDATALNISTNGTTRLNITAAGVATYTGSFDVVGATSITGTTSLLNASPLRFYEPSGSGTNFTAFQAQAQAADVTYTLPAADGTANQYLTTNGAGLLSWTSVSAQAWSITGNNNVTAAANFFGSINNQDVVMKASNTEKMRLLANSGSAISVTGSSTFSSWILLATQAGVAQELRFQSANGNGYTSFKAGSQVNANFTYTLPTSYGTAGQWLTTDSLGGLTWSGGSGTGVLYNVLTAQATAFLGTNWLFNVEYDNTTSGDSLGARIYSFSKSGGNNLSTGLTVIADGNSNGTTIKGIVVTTTTAKAQSPSTGVLVTGNTNGAAQAAGFVATVTCDNAGTAFGAILTANTSAGTNGQSTGASVTASGAGPNIGIQTQASGGTTNAALVVGAAGSASGWQRFASNLTRNNATNNSTPDDGYSVYTYTGNAPTGITLPGVATIGKIVTVINTTGGNMTVNIGGGTFTINQNRATMFISNGTNWYPMQN